MGTPAKVLIVDDDADIRWIIREILETAGVLPWECADCRGARERLAEQHFDIVFLDNNLPDGYGVDLIEFACEHATHVIMITAYANLPRFHKLAIERGATLVIDKPFSAEALLACLSGTTTP